MRACVGTFHRIGQKVPPKGLLVSRVGACYSIYAHGGVWLTQ